MDRRSGACERCELRTCVLQLCDETLKLLPSQICCEANQLLELVPALSFNDYEVYTMRERLLLLCFDFAFAWIAVVTTKEEVFSGTQDDDGSGNGHTACSDYDGFFDSIVFFMERKGNEHPGAEVATGLGQLLDFSGGYFIFEVIWVVLFNWSLDRPHFEDFAISGQFRPRRNQLH